MKFVFFVEGATEKKAALEFVRRWVNYRLGLKSVGFKSVNFGGFGNFYEDIARIAALHLNDPRSRDIIAGIGLLDLSGPNFFPPDKTTAEERHTWGKEYFEGKVGHPRFRMFFAVHEIEAWLFANPGGFPGTVRESFPKNISTPEKVNFDRPPARLLSELYWRKTKRGYKKVVDGNQLFSKLSVDREYTECPYLHRMMEELVQLARDAGL